MALAGGILEEAHRNSICRPPATTTARLDSSAGWRMNLARQFISSRRHFHAGESREQALKLEASNLELVKAVSSHFGPNNPAHF